MSVAAFDTYAAAKALRDAGFDERQAEAAVAMVRDAVTEGVATKADLRAEIAGLETRLTIRLGGLVVAVGGLVVALVKLLP